MVHWQAGLPEFFFMYGSSQQVPASAQNRENWEADGPNVHGCWILLGEQHYLQIWLVWWLGLSGKLQETMFFHLPSNYRGCLWNVPLIQFWGAGSWSRPLGPKKYMNHFKKNWEHQSSHLEGNDTCETTCKNSLVWFVQNQNLRFYGFFFQVLWRLRRNCFPQLDVWIKLGVPELSDNPKGLRGPVPARDHIFRQDSTCLESRRQRW